MSRRDRGLAVMVGAIVAIVLIALAVTILLARSSR